MIDKNEDNVSNNEGNSSTFTVDKSMLTSKIAYFLLYGAFGSYTPFTNIFFVSVGLTAKETGFISGLCFALRALACPCWGFVADSTGKRKSVFLILCVCTVLTTFAQPWVAWRTNAGYIVKCGQAKDIGNVTAETWQSQHFKQDCPERPAFASDLFYAMLALSLATNLFIGPLSAILDSFVMNIVKCSDKECSYGVQRLYGAISFGTTSLVAGLAADNYYHPTLSKYTAVYYVSLPFFLLFMPVGFILLKQTNWSSECNMMASDDEKQILMVASDDEEQILMMASDDEKQVLMVASDDENQILMMASDDEKQSIIENRGTTKLKVILTIFTKFSNLFFFLSVLVSGIAGSVTLSFLFLLMNDVMHAPKAAMGLAMFVACFFECLMFPFSGKIIKLLGSLTCIELGLLSFVIRLVAISYITNAWASVPIHFLHSLGFALYWAAAVEHVEEISSQSVHSTMFGILSSIHAGCGGLIGCLVGGMLYNKYGGQLLFRGMGTFTGGWVLIMFVYLHLLGGIKSQ